MENYNSNNYSLGIKSLTKCIQVAFFVLISIIIGMFIWLFLDGFFAVNPQEEVLVFRFGKFQASYKDSWHWAFPYPIDEIVRVPTKKLKINSYLFWTFAQDSMKNAPQQTRLVLGKDGYLLTGDANIIHSNWELIYHVSNAQKYYEKCLCPPDPAKRDQVYVNHKLNEVRGTRGPQTLLRNILENTVLEVTATKKIDDILRDKKEAYYQKVQANVARKIADLELGIVIDNVILKADKVPASTKKAFDDVIAAMQDSSGSQKEAEKYRVKLEGETGANVTQIEAKAEAYKKRTVAEIQSEVVYFNQILKQYKLYSDVILVTLYNNVLAKIYENVNKKFIIRSNSNGNQQVWLKLNPEPTTTKKK